MRANDEPNCKVRFIIDPKHQQQTLHKSPKTTIRSWESWNSINIPKAKLKYSRRRENVGRRKTEALNQATATTQLWTKVQQANGNIRRGLERTIKTAASTTASDEMTWLTDMISAMETSAEREIHDIENMEAENNNTIDRIDEQYDEDGDNECNDDEMRQAVFNGTVPTAIADAGASAHAVQTSISTCGKYKLGTDPFIPTGKKSSKIFAMPLGNIAPAEDIKRLPFNIRHPADEVHTVPGIKHNLVSMNQFAEAKYITIFDKDEVNIYDAINTEVTVL